LNHDSTGVYHQFLHSNDLKKAWNILSTDINHIQLDSQGCIFLCRCNGNIDKTGITGHMFISCSKFISVCDDCVSMKWNENKCAKRKKLNYDEQIKANSRTPFSYLTPERQHERFTNIKNEIKN